MCSTLCTIYLIKQIHLQLLDMNAARCRDVDSDFLFYMHSLHCVQSHRI